MALCVKENGGSAGGEAAIGRMAAVSRIRKLARRIDHLHEETI